MGQPELMQKVLRVITVVLGGTVAVTASTDSALAVTTSQQNSVAESNSKASSIKTDPNLSQSTDLLASQVPSELLYLSSHEWVRVDGNRVVVGFTDHAQASLSDIVYVELPEEGATLEGGDQMGVVESVKAASDLYAPVSGTVVSVNYATLEDYPETVNQDPYGEGWFVVIEMSDPSELDTLLDAAAYSEHIKE